MVQHLLPRKRLYCFPSETLCDCCSAIFVLTEHRHLYCELPHTRTNSSEFVMFPKSYSSVTRVPRADVQNFPRFDVFCIT